MAVGFSAVGVAGVVFHVAGVVFGGKQAWYFEARRRAAPPDPQQPRGSLAGVIFYVAGVVFGG